MAEASLEINQRAIGFPKPWWWLQLHLKLKKLHSNTMNIFYLGVALHKLVAAVALQQLHFPLAANPYQGLPSFRLLVRLDKSRHRLAGKEPSHGLNLKRRSQINFRLCTLTISDLLMMMRTINTRVVFQLNNKFHFSFLYAKKQQMLFEYESKTQRAQLILLRNFMN